ncbi:hypothetical protein IKQ21_06195 [bacterium]|nr:hypothetical protein [bacterium]
MDLSVAKINYIPSFFGRNRMYTDEYMQKTFIPYIEGDIPFEQVMKDHAISIQTLDAWSKEKFGMSFRKLYHTPMNKTLAARLQSKNAAGNTIREIAKSEGHSSKWVVERFKDFAILKQYEERQKLLDEFVPSMIKKGYTLERMVKEFKKISKKISISDSVISSWIAQNYGKSLAQIRTENKIYIDRENVDYQKIKLMLEEIFKNGGTITDASKKTGISKPMVFHWIERFGILTKMQCAKKNLDSILELRMAQGNTSKEIAKEVGVSATTVLKHARKLFKMTFSKAQRMLIKTYFTKH